MMYGLNFGGPDIPAQVRKRLRDRRRFAINGETALYALVGACHTVSEADQMFAIATNGRRKLHRTERWIKLDATGKPSATAVLWFGIYAG